MISMVLLAFSLLGIAECDVCFDENAETLICDYGCCTSYDYIYDTYYDNCCLESSLPSSDTTTTTPPTTYSLPDSTSEASWSDGNTAGVVVGSISFLGIVFAGIVFRIHAYRKTGNALPECKIGTHFQGMVIGYQFPVPDFESPWILLEAQAGISKAKKEIDHGLNEVPLIVDVQVKSQDAPNEGYIFQATGGITRDDDEPEPYSGVTYIYDESKVTVCAPQRNNGVMNGYAIYTEDGDYFIGANSQRSYNVNVRVRARRKTSLPPADFVKTGIPMEAGNTTNVSDVYLDKVHGFHEYPSMTIVRMNFIDHTRGALTAMSDAVGANFVTYRVKTWRHNSYTVHGVSKDRIRVWIDSQYAANVFYGLDGHPFNVYAVRGYLEMYAWKPNTMASQEYSQTLLGPNVPNGTFEMPYKNNVHNPFTRIWVRSTTGPNAGFMFLGSGAMAYVKTPRDSVCSYGGLVYAYDTLNIRFWRPTSAINGGLICVSHFFGNGTNSQLSTDTEVVIRSWGVDSIRNTRTWKFEVPQNTCRKPTRIPVE